MTLRVKLEIIPCGDEDKAREIGRLDIFNAGEVDTDLYRYGVIDLSPGHVGLYEQNRGLLLHYGKLGAWALLRKVLCKLPVEGP